MGRPAGPGRQRGARGHGLRDVWLRVRTRGRLGARGDLLGCGGHLAGRRALQRRPRALRRARRRTDGPDLREPRGPQRQPRPVGVGPRHPRDVRPDGDERRGDRRADRRWSHVRQDARCRRRRPGRSGARGLPGDVAGARLAQPARVRQGRRLDHQRPRGDLDRPPHGVEQPVLRDPLRLRVGADREPGRRQAVGRKGRRGDHPRRLRRSQPAAVDAHVRPGTADGPRVREDLAPVPREPRRVPARVRQGLVQAAAPRHGPGRPLPRSLGRRAAALAGPGAGRRPRADRRGRRSPP